jgi:hypothetical protein
MAYFTTSNLMVQIYDISESLPFVVQIDKQSLQEGILSFVDRNTAIPVEIPTGISLVSSKDSVKETPISGNILDKRCFYIVINKSYDLVYENSESSSQVIMKLRPLMGWHIIS